MVIYQEKIEPPGPLPDFTEPRDVLSLTRTIESIKRENVWLRAQLARTNREK
jgi:IS1 family transposase